MKFKAIFPNMLTAGNLLFGLAAIFFAFGMFYSIEYAFICMLLAAACDLLDGMLARALRVQSEFGKQLDSLSDIVSFGVAPAFTVFFILLRHSYDLEISNIHKYLFFVIPALFAVSAAFRLAKFNIDSKQTKNFRGLPTPAAALFVVSFSLYWAKFFGQNNLFNSILIVTFLFSVLMLLPVSILSMKLHDAKSRIFALIMLVASILIIWFFSYSGVSIIILLYILLSFIIIYVFPLFCKKTISEKNEV